MCPYFQMLCVESCVSVHKYVCLVISGQRALEEQEWGMSCKDQECLWDLSPGGRCWTKPLNRHHPFLLHQSQKATQAHVEFYKHVMCWCWTDLDSLVFSTRSDNSDGREEDIDAHWKGLLVQITHWKLLYDYCLVWRAAVSVHICLTYWTNEQEAHMKTQKVIHLQRIFQLLHLSCMWKVWF